MRSIARFTVLASSLLAAFSGTADAAKPAAQYWMSVSTENMSVPGMDSAASGGGLEGMLGSMAMKSMGVGGGTRRNVFLDLLGPDTPPAPSAEHLIPPGMKMGASLPLRYETKPGGSTDGEAKREDIKILLYWGCGESVRTGQPRVLDTARMTAEDYASVLVARGGGSRFRLTPRKGWTFGEWPNRENQQAVPDGSSLVGEHLIKGNYTPDIRFTLDERRDFMAPVVFTQAEGGLADAVKIEWKSIPTAIGYFMMAVGGSEQGKEVVIWTSSELADMGGGLMSYLPNATVQKYIQQKVVMKPDATRCTLPKGIFGKADGAAVQFIAYGDEGNFAYPPKPADPKAKWEPIWTAKVRLKSMGMLPLGVEGAGGASAAETSGKAEKPKEETSPVDSAVEGVKKLKSIFGF